jgi:hypothetical protein
MYCGPYAVAKLTGWTKDQVWLHIRWLREQQGKRLTDHPIGGTQTTECISALERAGYDVTPVFTRKRMRYDAFLKQHGTGGRWLLRQHNHFFARLPGDRVHHPRAIIVSAYRVTKRKREVAA